MKRVNEEPKQTVPILNKLESKTGPEESSTRAPAFKEVYLSLNQCALILVQYMEFTVKFSKNGKAKAPTVPPGIFSLTSYATEI